MLLTSQLSWGGPTSQLKLIDRHSWWQITWYQIQELVVVAGNDVPQVEYDKVVVVSCALVLILAVAVLCIRHNSASVAEVTRAKPSLKGQGMCGEVLEISLG